MPDFVSAGAQVKTTVRTIYSLEVECIELGKAKPDGENSEDLSAGTDKQKENNRLIKIRVNGNGFLYNMVRIIAGTLLEVGKENIPSEKMGEIIASTDRAKAGPTAPARGLKLVEIRYV